MGAAKHQTGAVYGRESVEALHRSTMHGELPAHPDRLLPFRPIGSDEPAQPNEEVPGRRSRLPVSRAPTFIVAGCRDTVGRRAEFELLDEGLLGTMLFLAAGVTRVGRTTDGGSIWFRTTMSAGNLHSVDGYVVDDDVHHYHPLDHALVPLRRAVNVCDDPGWRWSADAGVAADVGADWRPRSDDDRHGLAYR